MIAVPAVDLREGACVQLVGGAYDAERVRLADPLAAALRWRAAGFAHLHVVDLDAATGAGENADVVRTLVARSGMEVSVGGGVRDDAAVDEWLDRGARRVVVGTRAVEDPAWLAAVAARHPWRIVVAADVRDRRVVTRGWAADGGRDVDAVVAALGALPLAGLLVTAVHREGRMAGPDLALIESLVRSTRLPVTASGGVASLHDLASLQTAGAARAVLGMALYTGALEPAAVAKEFRS